MAYTNGWTNDDVSDSTPAVEIDDRIDKVRLDLQERMDTIIGLADANNGWNRDPVIDGTTVRSLFSFTTSPYPQISQAGNIVTLLANKFFKVTTFVRICGRTTTGTNVHTFTANTTSDILISVGSGVGIKDDPLGILGGDNKTITIPTDAGGMWLFMLYFGSMQMQVTSIPPSGNLTFRLLKNGAANAITFAPVDINADPAIIGTVLNFWIVSAAATDTFKFDCINNHATQPGFAQAGTYFALRLF